MVYNPNSVELRKRPARRGLQAITIENFKGIGEPITIPLRPLTLLFGPNSAGKSTVVQALQYAAEVFEHFRADVDKTAYGGDHVSLGGFKNIVHQHDLEREIGITLHFYGDVDFSEFSTNKDTFNNVSNYDFDADRVDLSGHIGNSHGDHWAVRVGVRYGEWRKSAYVSTFSIELNFEPLCHLDFGLQLYLNAKHPSINESLNSILMSGELRTILSAIQENHANDYMGGCVSYEEYAQVHPEVWPIYCYDNERHNVPPVASNLNLWDQELPAQLARESRRGWTSSEKYSFRAHQKVWDLDQGVALVQNQGSLAYDEQFLIAIFDYGEDEISPNARMSDEYRVHENAIACVLTQLVKAPVRAVSRCLSNQAYLGPFRSGPAKYYGEKVTSEFNPGRWSHGSAAWDLICREPKSVDNISHHLESTLGLPYRLILDESILLPMDEDLMQRLQTILDKMHESSIASGVQDIAGSLLAHDRISRIKLLDTSSDTILELRDVGIGLTQVLPVVVGLLLDRSTIFSVEQPELHMHPAIQSRMGDLFIRATKDKNYPQYRRVLLETHSEHIILRILRRIREANVGALPDGFPTITPQDVQVVYINKNVKGETTAHLQEITIDGDFATHWPDGFFDERDEDLF